MSATTKALIERLVESVWNRVEDEQVERLVAEEYVGHPSGVVGTEAYKRFYRDLHSAAPDMTFTIEDQIAEGDKVTTRWTASRHPPRRVRWHPPVRASIHVRRYEHAPGSGRQGRGVLDEHGRSRAVAPNRSGGDHRSRALTGTIEWIATAASSQRGCDPPISAHAVRSRDEQERDEE